jgi:hypothetical protein
VRPVTAAGSNTGEEGVCWQQVKRNVCSNARKTAVELSPEEVDEVNHEKHNLDCPKLKSGHGLFVYAFGRN